MKTRKIRLLSALLALAMLLALLPTAAFADTVYGTVSGVPSGNCGAEGNNLTWTLDSDGTLTISGTGKMADYSKNVRPWVNYTDKITKLVVQTGVTSIGDGAFLKCWKLGSVELPEGLEEIGNFAFICCGNKNPGSESLESIHIPSTVTKIGSECFYGCPTLKEVTFEPDSKLEKVDSDAFGGCNNLTIYYSDSNVETALSGKAGSETMVKRVKVTFDFDNGNAASIQTVANGETVTEPTPNPTRDGWDFAGWYTKNADNEYELFDFDTTITENITLYGKRTPGGNCGDNLTWILDDNGTLTISGSGAMADYDKKPQPWVNQRDNIKHLVVENGVTSIGDSAFRDCTKLIDADLSKASSLETIKTSFPGCTGLENVVLNEGLVEIGGSAFNTCTSLGSIHIPSTVTAIGSYCFERCTSLSKVTFADGIQLTTIAEATFAGCKILETITIPKKVKEIQTDAFNGCGGLKNVTFEPGSELETIGDVAFQDTAISEISIPASVKTIGSYVFRCVLDEKLTKVIFESPSSLENVSQLTFVGCSKATIYGDDNVMSKLSGIVAADKIKPANLTVTFDFDNGTEAENKQVENGEKVTPPTAPTKEDYIFAGWYTKDANDKWADKPFDFSKAVTDDMTLYARWEKLPDHQLTVIGGTFAVKDETIETETKDDAVIANIPVDAEVTVAFNKEAYADSNQTFGGWVIEGLDDAENYTNQETFTFTMPQNGVRIEAMTKFADVDDSGWDAATVVTGAVIGTGTAILAYHIGMEVYAEQVLGKDVAVPRTRAEVALLAWQLAGSPAVNGEGEPLSEAAQAEKWAVESGLMEPDAAGNFNGAKKMSKLKALRTLEKAKQ